MGDGPILEVDGLVKRFGTTRAVDGVSFVLARGETLAIVGESGSGKTTVARLLVRLLTPDAGTIRVDGRVVAERSRRDVRALRERVQLVFQDSFGALDPRMRVAQIVAEPLVIAGRRRVDARARELIGMVGLGPELLGRHPHELSGGQRQRVGIARALALEPDVVVLDEPVTALDVSVQAQVLNLLTDLQQRLGIAYVLIAHDLAVVRAVADRVAVMHRGCVVEAGVADDVYGAAAHPYTQALLSACPDPDPERERTRERILLPAARADAVRQHGCRFRDRCWRAEARCEQDDPRLEDRTVGHPVACHFPAVLRPA